MKRAPKRNFVKIAVIGGGPKAAALASKASCINRVTGSDLRVTIFERSSIGASWDGEHGYTNGQQALCTPAERDVGFPYNSEADPEVEILMQREFSWNAFKVASRDYREWICKGRLPPSHLEFSSYLKFCVERSKAKVVLGEVGKVSSVNGLWKIELVPTGKEAGAKKFFLGFDALVVTGHGPQANRFPKAKDKRVFDGVDVWKRFDSLLKLARKDQSGAIVLIGAGGTSAAIAGWLVRKEVRNPIVILGNQASFFARVDNWFENKVFTDKDLWQSLAHSVRRDFTDRLTRGAVWANVLGDISKAGNITYRAAEAKGVLKSEHGEVQVHFRMSDGDSDNTIPALAVVDATGFDDMWFMSLLPDDLKIQLGDRKAIQEKLSESLAIKCDGYAPIHLPMLSQLRSPAFVSLMALGEMSTDVLLQYVTS